MYPVCRSRNRICIVFSVTIMLRLSWRLVVLRSSLSSYISTQLTPFLLHFCHVSSSEKPFFRDFASFSMAFTIRIDRFCPAIDFLLMAFDFSLISILGHEPNFWHANLRNILDRAGGEHRWFYACLIPSKTSRWLSFANMHNECRQFGWFHWAWNMHLQTLSTPLNVVVSAEKWESNNVIDF